MRQHSSGLVSPTRESPTLGVASNAVDELKRTSHAITGAPIDG